MRFRPCECPAPQYVREHRASWMRWLLPSQRLWSCTHCGTRFLATKAIVAASPGGAAAVQQHLSSAPQSIR